MRLLGAAVAFVTLASCASQTQPRVLKVDVFEQRGRSRPMSVAGQHAFVIRVTNQSEETITIAAISLSSQNSAFQIQNGDQVLGDVLESGETRDFSMFVDVVAQQINTYIYTIDSIDVSVTCQSPTRGNFTETSDQRVMPVD